MVKMGKKTSLHLVKVGKPAMDEGEEKKEKNFLNQTLSSFLVLHSR